jgi:hypothetical protein
MRKRKIELEVDSIGNQKDKITKEEEKMISEYIRSHKSKKIRKPSKKEIV